MVTDFAWKTEIQNTPEHKVPLHYQRSEQLQKTFMKKSTNSHFQKKSSNRNKHTFDSRATFAKFFSKNKHSGSIEKILRKLQIVLTILDICNNRQSNYKEVART